MMPSAQAEQTLAADPEQVIEGLEQARARTLALVAHLSAQQLERVHSPIMSPLVWDLAHIAAYEDLWLARRLGGLELLRADLAERYDAFETPRAMRAEVELLDTPSARDYLGAVRSRVLQALSRGARWEATVCEMVVRHELQHTETMRQTMAIAGLLPPGEPALGPMREPPGWLQVPAGGLRMGASEQGFAYDNERPRHLLQLPAFQIARRPASNGEILRFAEDGGYERRELWSREGWEWRAGEDRGPHPAVSAGEPAAAACHVSFFEAQAFARWQGARLPSEAEWEAAARRGELAGAGQVWEWTSSEFDGYPGFRAHPYREYSEVFFGAGYRVLRGGSWATAPRVKSVTFRNWDLPQRRQIFAGVRLARDAA